MNNINSYISIIAFGSLLIATLYQSNLYYFNRTEVLKTYCIYLCLCLILLYFEIFIFNENLRKIVDNPSIFHQMLLPYFIRTVALWLSIMYYLKLVIVACEYNNKNRKSITYLISNYFWIIIPFYLLYHFPSFFVGKDNYYIFNYLGIAINLITLLIVMYFLFIIIKHYYKINKNSEHNYQIFIIFGLFTLVVFNIFAIIANFKKQHTFLNLTYLSYFSIGYFFEIFCFSMGISLKMKTDALREFWGNKKAKDQEVQLQNEVKKVADILDNQELKLDYERNRALIDQNNIIGRRLHDDLTGSLVALKYLINDYKNTSNTADEKDKLINIESEIDVIYNETRNFSHQLTNRSEIRFEQSFDLKLYLQKLSSQFNQLDLHQIFYNIDQPMLEKLSNLQTTCLYYCIKECLIKALMHQQPQNIWISILFSSNRCNLEFKVDNIGLKTKLEPDVEIKNIYNNLQLLNGTMKILSNKLDTTINIGFDCDLIK